MSYIGQPIPSTTYSAIRAKVGDGKSVIVTVPGNTTIDAGKLYLLDGFLGFAMQSVTTGEGETKEVILNIEMAEYETDQIDVTKAFTVGTEIYWDNTAKKLTETPTDNRKAGRVTSEKDAGNVIWFILGPQV